MYLDSQLKLSDSQALTATAVSTNVINLGTDNQLTGGEPVALVVFIEVAADGTTTDETYNFELQTATDEAFTTPIVLCEATPGYAELTAGKKVVLFGGGQENEQYVRVNYVLGGTTPSVTVSAYLSPISMIDFYKDYANGYTVTS
jgi:hypothetical protein